MIHHLHRMPGVADALKNHFLLREWGCWCLPLSQGGPHRSEGFRASSGWKAGLGSSLPHLLTVGSLAACFSLPWCKETTESVLGAMKLSKTRGGPQNSCQATVFCAGLSLQGLWVHGPSRFWVSGSISTSTNLRHLTQIPLSSLSQSSRTGF